MVLCLLFTITEYFSGWLRYIFVTKKTTTAFWKACFNGHVEILDMLGREPWCLTTADAEADDNAAMRHACESIQSAAIAQKLMRCC